MPKNEISVSMGMGRTYSNNVKGCPALASVNRNYEIEPSCGPGLATFNGRYFRNINKRIAVGLSVELLGRGTDHYSYEVEDNGKYDEYGCIINPIFDVNGDNVLDDKDHLGEAYFMTSVFRRDICAMPSLRVYWLNNTSNIGLYSIGSLGFRFSKTEDTDNNPYDGVDFNCNNNKFKFAYDIVPLGFEYGLKHWRVFAEIFVNNVGAGGSFGTKVMF